MFNMQKIGRKISSLREGSNMSQTELADKLSVSCQAVCNWEQGDSMPDVTGLPELTAVFGVSLEELLGEKSALLEAVLNGTLAEYAKSRQISHVELDSVLPILKPSQIDILIQNMDDPNTFAPLLPYLSEDELAKTAAKILESGGSIKELLPFMAEEDINRLAVQEFLQKNM